MSDDKNEQNAMIKITGLWKNKSDSGVGYLVGYFGSAKILIFNNTYKKSGDKQPDFNMFVVSGKRTISSDDTEDVEF